MSRPDATAPTSDPSRYVHPDAARLAAWRRVYDNYLVVSDVYTEIAERFVAHGVRRFAEIGGGRGPIAEVLARRGIATAVVDLDEQMIADGHKPAARGDLRALPIASGSCDGVAAVNCFYFLDDPFVGIAEARRILAPGGVFVASSPSRCNDPELADIAPGWGEPGQFDSEDAARLVGAVFGDIEVEPYSVVAYVLPDEAAIADYLHAFNVPDWADRARAIEPPFQITKVGAQVWARA